MKRGRKAIVALVLAETFSISGTRLSMIALPWLVLTLTGDAVLTGVLALAELAPYVIAKVLGGPLIDRLGARRIAITSDLGSMVVMACVPMLSQLDLLGFYTLLPLVVLLGTLRGPADAAKQAMVPTVAQEGGMALERMTGIMGTIERLASTVGAAAAGALVAAMGAAPALAFNTIGFALSALILLLGTSRRPVIGGSPEERSEGYGKQLLEGWRFLRRDAVLTGIAGMVAVTNLFDQAFSVVLIPVWAIETGHGAAILGLVFAVFSGASVLGSLVATAFASKLPRLAVYTGAFLIVGLPRFAVFALGLPLPAILATLALSGFCSGFLNPILSAVIFERIPARLLGRVSALVNASAWALMPLGGVVGGGLIALVGLGPALMLLGIAYFGATLAPLIIKRFRAFSERPSPA